MIQQSITGEQSVRSQRDSPMIDFLRAMVIVKPFDAERFHVVFVDSNHAYLGDAPMGSRRARWVSLRMRDLFAMALSHGARGILVAHNHPSGLCRPSRTDIESTRRMETVAAALDIDLLDHLIFTKDAVYSMRAGAIHEFKSRKPVFSR